MDVSMDESSLAKDTKQQMLRALARQGSPEMQSLSRQIKEVQNKKD
jgi:hypothetical protein